MLKAEESLKRPLSSYFRFMADTKVIEKLKHENPDAKGKERIKAFGAMWKDLPEKEKKPYEDAFLKDKAIYEKKIEKNPELKKERQSSKAKVVTVKEVEHVKKVKN